MSLCVFPVPYQASWTPIHLSIHAGHADCLKLLITYKSPIVNHSNRGNPRESIADDVINLVDKDGWTIAHLAAIRETKVCGMWSEP